MPKVGTLGASMLRGNSTNFYIRDDADLDDQDTETYRGDEEYPHIHVATNGAERWNDIVYVGITFGGDGENITLYRDGQAQVDANRAVELIRQNCPGISSERVVNLVRYLFGLPFSVQYQ